MKLNDLEQAMFEGAHGRAAQWAIEYQRSVGTFFDAEDFVRVRVIHVSTDPVSYTHLTLPTKA